MNIASDYLAQIPGQGLLGGPEAAQQFGSEEMQIGQEFLRRILPPGNLYSVSRRRPNEAWGDEISGGGPAMVHRLFTLSRSGFNSYFGLSTFAQGWHDVKGQQKFRTQANAVAQKCVFLDIDVAPKSIYTDWQNALLALHDFTKTFSFPEPMITISGKGLHVFWTFTQAVPTQAWLTITGLMEALCRYHRLDVDRQRTTDPVSSPRLPGTINYDKDGSTNPVKLLLWSRDYDPVEFSTHLVNIVETLKIPFRPGKISEPTPDPIQAYTGPQMSERMWREIQDANTGFKGAQRHPLRIIQECAQIQKAPFTLGRYAWYAMVSVMGHCLYGREATHELSALDRVRYSYDDTEAAFNQFIEGGSGPALCDTFERHNPGGCGACEYRGKIKSPIVLGTTQTGTVKLSAPVVSSEADISLVPVDAPAVMSIQPYNDRKFVVIPHQQDKPGGVFWKRKVLVGTQEELREEDEDDASKKYIEQPIRICDSEVYITSTYDDDGKRSYIVRQIPYGKAAQDLKFSIEDNLGTQQLTKWLGNAQLLPKSSYDRKMYEFMRAHIHQAQHSAQETQIKDRFGWTTLPDVTTGRTHQAFIVGDTLYSDLAPMRTYMAERCGEAINSEYTSMGSLDEWKKFPDMYRVLNQYDAMLLICAAFAAPLMRFSNGTAKNLLLSLWDTQGGRGKTTLLQGVNSVWGHPSKLMARKGDSSSARYQVLSVRQNLPMCLDELTLMDEAEVVDMLLTIANGQQSRKSLAGGNGLMKTGDWSTVCYFSANTSLYETVAKWNPQSPASAMRVMELKCHFPNYAGTEWGRYIEDTISIIDTNYGLAGRYFVEQLCKHPHLFEEIKRRAKEWDLAHRRNSDERFWTYGMSQIIMGGRLSKAFDLHRYDMDLLEKYCEDMLDYLRRRVISDRTTGQDLLGTIINESMKDTLIVKCDNRPTDGKHNDPGRKVEWDSYVIQWPSNTLAIRIHADTGRIEMSSAYLRKLAGQKRVSTDTLLQDLVGNGTWRLGHKEQCSLGRGVSVLPRTRTMCYIFDGSKLDLPEPAKPEMPTEPSHE